jgi:hypothetical protein
VASTIKAAMCRHRLDSTESQGPHIREKRFARERSRNSTNSKLNPED